MINRLLFLVANTEIEMQHIYESVYDPVYENIYDVVMPCSEMNFQSIQEQLNKLSSCEILRVRSCPSMLSAVNWMSMLVEKFFKMFSSAKCVEFHIDCLAIVELNEYYYIKFVEKFREFRWSFMVSFESSIDESFCIYWRIENTEHIFSLCVAANDAKICSFTKNFLMMALKNGKNGN